MFQGDGLNVVVVCHVLCMSAKPGVCPRKNLGVAVSGVCDEMCSHDSDCPKNKKCCSNGCGLMKCDAYERARSQIIQTKIFGNKSFVTPGLFITRQFFLTFLIVSQYQLPYTFNTVKTEHCTDESSSKYK